jgi:hypothetical protein
MMFNATFNIIQLYHGGPFYWWRKSEYPKKTTDLTQVTDQPYHIMVALNIITLTPIFLVRIFYLCDI